MNQLAEWDSFYLIVGGAAGALIGLQFVAMTLIAARPQAAASSDAGAAFATPTIVHFVAAFLLAAFIRMPWHSESSAIAICGLLGAAGLVYTVVVSRRMTTQTAYKPVFEDWLFHAILPLLAYAILVIAAIEDSSYPRQILFAVGAATLLLLMIGIHNSWDAVTWNVYAAPSKPDDATHGDDVNKAIDEPPKE